MPQRKGLKSKVIAPGVIYDVHHQCQLQYGPNATFCQEVEVSAGVLVALVGCAGWRKDQEIFWKSQDPDTEVQTLIGGEQCL